MHQNYETDRFELAEERLFGGMKRRAWRDGSVGQSSGRTVEFQSQYPCKKLEAAVCPPPPVTKHRGEQKQHGRGLLATSEK